MKHIFILNPAAGTGTAQEKFVPMLRDFLKSEPLDYEIHRTLGKEEVESFCKQRAARGGETRFYACGGDGTICDVVNGIAGFENASLAVYPCGTGNDFVKNFTNKENFSDIRKSIRGAEEPCDLIKTEKGYFINMVNVGLDSEVAAAVNEHKNGMVKGPALYVSELIKAVAKLKSYRMVYEKDGETHEEDFLLTCVGNGCFCGGGFCSCSEALLNDGLLDVCMVRPVKLPTFIRLVGKYHNGTLLMDKAAEKYIIYFRASHFSLKALSPAKVSVDGETSDFFGSSFDVVPKAVRVAVPEGSKMRRS